MAKDPADKIGTEGSGTQPSQGLGGPVQRPEKGGFESYMQQPQAPERGAAPGAGPQTPEGVSPMELPGGTKFQTAGPSIDTLLGQVNTTQNNLNQLQDQMNTPNLKFKRQHQYLMQNKLADANGNLQAAGQKLGAEIPASQQLTGGPVQKFLGMIADGQNQLIAAKSELQKIKAKGTSLNPGDLIMVQVKLAQAQQELEYASVLLSKVIDAIKMMMNIQL